MSGLTLTVLVDNAAIIDRYFLAEPGLSIFLECGKKRVLFDTGYSGIFLKNAEKMGIDLLDLDYVVLSHGHVDHTGGLMPLVLRHLEATIEGRPHRSPTIVAHPSCFFPRPTATLANAGSPVSEDEMKRQFPVQLSREPLWLADDLVFLGEIPRPEALPAKKKRLIVTPSGTETDHLLDDTALAYRSGSGLVVITGCSHAGIGNIVRYAQEVCGVQEIRDVIGGFHLYDAGPQEIGRTAAEFAALKPAALHPCHCTGLAARIVLAQVAPVKDAGVGLRLEYS
jgi:7,8-dihydropterin-6-yl-methyl-4-(beta-D-ribofuranosyl)aminobenzene 5'-phosphate synthase